MTVSFHKVQLHYSHCTRIFHIPSPQTERFISFAKKKKEKEEEKKRNIQNLFQV